MTKRIALALTAALAIAGCGGDDPAGETAGTTTTAGTKAAGFSTCMRDHGIKNFPDPDASGELTIDLVANEAQVDTDTPAFRDALAACQDLQPAGFTGRKRTAKEQEPALQFAQCMRENGIPDFPDPEKDGPLIDTNRIPSAKGRGALEIPGFTAATEKCSARYGDELGLKRK